MVSKEMRDTYTYITCLCAAQIINETQEDLKGTTGYRQKLKSIAKNFLKEINQELIKDIEEIYEADDIASNKIIEGIEAVIKELSTLHPSDIASIAELIKNLKTNNV